MRELHIDIETYSSVDIKSCGAYKYLESVDFEILLCAYAFDNGSVKIVDLAQGEKLPSKFLDALQAPQVKKFAHNAVFERQAFKNFGLEVPVNQWHCTAVHSAYCGLPLSLDMVSKVLNFGEDKAKFATGKALIRYFCMPCKPTKSNGGRYRNLPSDDLEKWEQFKEYCIQDVEAEREIEKRLKDYPLPKSEREIYILDQEINDRGISIDTDMAKSAFNVDQKHAATVSRKIKQLTGVDNPNSVAQLKEWLSEATGEEVNSLAKDNVTALLAEEVDDNVREVLHLRQASSKSSIKKYTAMLNCVCADGRGHGFFQFYGANRTGRWPVVWFNCRILQKTIYLTLRRREIRSKRATTKRSNFFTGMCRTRFPS